MHIHVILKHQREKIPTREANNILDINTKKYKTGTNKNLFKHMLKLTNIKLNITHRQKTQLSTDTSRASIKMASSVRMPLLQTKTKKCPTTRPKKWIERSYRAASFHSKGALLSLICVATVVAATQMMLTTTNFLLSNSKQKIILDGLLSVTVFVPFLGYLGERIHRYNLIMSGGIIVVFSYLINMVLLILEATVDKEQEDFHYYILLGLVLLSIPTLCGCGLCIANILQFGATQLQFAPTDNFAAFSRWSVCILLTSISVVDFCLSAISTYPFRYSQIVANTPFFFATAIAVALSYRLRHILIIDPLPHTDSIRLIWRVMKFAWKHKHPLRPSAFTYSDSPPSRLDLAKERYGGPFTTDQVEDVKSFWYLVALPVFQCLNTSFYSSVPLGKQYASYLGKQNKLSLFTNIVTNHCTLLPNTVAIVGFMILYLILVPHFQKYIPTLLKRIWIGFFFLLLSEISVTIISINVTKTLPVLMNQSTNQTSFSCDKLWSYYVLTIPEALAGIGLLLTLTSQTEFLFAQAPQTMQGILIGMLCGQYVFPYLNNIVGTYTVAGKHWQYYASLVGLQMAILLALTVLVYRYKYRKRNEPSDINVRAMIEEIFEKDFEAREKEQMRNKYKYSLPSETDETCKTNEWFKYTMQ